jgi:hypothetical protein
MVTASPKIQTLSYKSAVFIIPVLLFFTPTTRITDPLPL